MTEHQEKSRALFGEQVPLCYDRGFKDGSTIFINYYGKFSREQFHKWFTVREMAGLSTEFEDACYGAYLCGWNVARGGGL